jgi:L-lactate dehydrogenase complex protein LldG
MLDAKNSKAKAEILSTIRKNLQTSAPHDVVHSEHQRGPTLSCDIAAAVISKTERPLTEEFYENLEMVGGKCTIVPNIESASAALKTILADLDPRRIAISDSPLVRSIVSSLATNAKILTNAPTAELFNCEVGITGAQLAIAETGTLVLRSEEESSRLTSLVPDVHICILEAEKIRETMAEALGILRDDLNPTVTFITGPSRTSDIELTLAIGVHGPRELHVIVIA